MVLKQDHNQYQSDDEEDSNLEESKLSQRYEKLNLSAEDRKNLKIFKRFNTLKWLIHKQTLRKGDLLGHEEFLKMTTKNHASTTSIIKREDQVVALEKTGLIIIQKSDYLRVLKGTEDREFSLISFLQENIPFFKNLNIRTSKKLIEKATQVPFNINNFVYRQGNEASNLYIVLDG